jgi:glycosyltransferase involved in cell wall biosynthesis
MNHSMAVKLLVFESHPIQYRAPVYERLEQLCPGAIHVAYASDFSIRGGNDPGFGQSVAWDSDLLAGYSSTVFRTDLTQAPASWGALDGRGVALLLARLKPKAILLNSLNFRFDAVAYALARLRGIPVWIRCETQDEAYKRTKLKSLLRFCYYRLIYLGIQRAFPIGQLNRQHWLKHGLTPWQLRSHAHYCTVDRAGQLSERDRNDRRNSLRLKLELGANDCLIAFFGKLIPKKDPLLLFQCLPYLPAEMRCKSKLLFVGSGELGQQLEQEALIASQNLEVESIFPGFVNQSSLVNWYLAADIVVLPSRKAGETWGLVANEALQAGCGVVVSEAVGCAADFGGWERFRTIPVGSPQALAQALVELAAYPRNHSWAAEALQNYSIEAAAQALASAISELP